MSYARHVEYDKVKHFAVFLSTFYVFLHGNGETCIFLHKWVDEPNL